MSLSQSFGLSNIATVASVASAEMIAQKVADYTTQIKLALAAWPGVHVRVEAGEAFVREEGTTPLPSQLPSPLPSPLPLPPSDLQDGRRLQQAGVQQCADFVAVIPIQVVLALTDPMTSPAIAQMLEDMPSELDNDDGKTFVEKALDSSTHAHTGHSQGLA